MHLYIYIDTTRSASATHSGASDLRTVSSGSETVLSARALDKMNSVFGIYVH